MGKLDKICDFLINCLNKSLKQNDISNCFQVYGIFVLKVLDMDLFYYEIKKLISYLFYNCLYV